MLSGNLMLAGWLDSSPSWKPIAVGLIARWPHAAHDASRDVKILPYPQLGFDGQSS